MDDCLLKDYDLHLLAEGTHYRSFERLGAQVIELNGEKGVNFAVWAPNAEYVSVIGDFNGWDRSAHSLELRQEAGIWETFVRGLEPGSVYKYWVVPNNGSPGAEKSDPYAFMFERRPKSGSMVWDLKNYHWNDQQWMNTRGERQQLDSPISIYELHLGSWKKTVERDVEGRSGYITYTDLAKDLPEYVRDMGYTHVELMPICEHPFDASWGYQTLGYFAPTSRFGTPDEFMYLVDRFHQCGIGVILDWVPGHFPKDGHGLGLFDGTHLYEHADPRRGQHPDWGTYVFNLGRREVANFLLSSALFWLERFHLDGLRLDAVASMLYLDYSRKDGEWVPNEYGGNEDISTLFFLRRFNELVYSQFPDVMTFAEESTAWPMVSRPTYLGGLGFGFKWNMGWMHDTLLYMSKDSVYRQYHHNNLTFGLLYAFQENFVLPYSHDEVVHGKGSMLAKMPGDEWQQFANLRLLYGFMYAHPGKKLMFMGSEFGQRAEWNDAESLDWHVLEYSVHQGVQSWVRDINHVLRQEPALHQIDFEHHGFDWVDCNDSHNSVLSFLRYGHSENDIILCVCNFTPVVRKPYRIGVPRAGYWKELINSDSQRYGGSNVGNCGGMKADNFMTHGREYSLELTVPPLACMYFKYMPEHE